MPSVFHHASIATLIVLAAIFAAAGHAHAGFFGSSRAERAASLSITNPVQAETATRKLPVESFPPAQMFEPETEPTVEVAQAAVGKIHLAQLLPAGWVILVYESPDGGLIPARVINAAGDVMSVEDVSESTVVWVTIDAEGFVDPLQVDPGGDLKPARADTASRPVVDEILPDGTKVFAAQISDEGNILPILKSLTDGFIAVRITDKGALVRTEPKPAPKEDEKKKFSASLVIDNSGGGETGPQNVTSTVAYEDILGTGHNVLLGATASASHPQQSKSAFVTYTVPFNGGVEGLPDQLALSAYYFDIDYDDIAPNQDTPARFAINGYGVSPSYTQYLSLSEGEDGAQTVQALIYTASFDRYWTRDFGFGQDSRTSLVRMPLSLTYGVWHGSDSIGSANMRFKYTRNLPIYSAGNGDDYRADRTFADPNYDKINLSAYHQFPSFKGWRLSESLSAQYARDPLVSAEGFGLGGQYSIRGLEDSRTIGDSGASLQVELETPDIVKSEDLEMRLLTFVDSGYTNVNQHATGVGSESAVGTGIGARVTAFENIFANFTAGWLVGGTAYERYKDEDGQLQLYFNAGMNF